jgi:hypothetical protein
VQRWFLLLPPLLVLVLVLVLLVLVFCSDQANAVADQAHPEPG